MLNANAKIEESKNCVDNDIWNDQPKPKFPLWQRKHGMIPAKLIKKINAFPDNIRLAVSSIISSVTLCAPFAKPGGNFRAKFFFLLCHSKGMCQIKNIVEICPLLCNVRKFCGSSVGILIEMIGSMVTLYSGMHVRLQFVMMYT